jgi:hypothetical protein
MMRPGLALHYISANNSSKCARRTTWVPMHPSLKKTYTDPTNSYCESIKGCESRPNPLLFRPQVVSLSNKVVTVSLGFRQIVNV